MLVILTFSGTGLFNICYSIQIFVVFLPDFSSLPSQGYHWNNTRVWDYFCCMDRHEFRLLDFFQANQTVHFAPGSWSFLILCRSNPKSSRKDVKFPITSTYQGGLEGNFHCGLKCCPFKNLDDSWMGLENLFHDQKSGRSPRVGKVSCTHAFS